MQRERAFFRKLAAVKGLSPALAHYSHCWLIFHYYGHFGTSVLHTYKFAHVMTIYFCITLMMFLEHLFHI